MLPDVRVSRPTATVPFVTVPKLIASFSARSAVRSRFTTPLTPFVPKSFIKTPCFTFADPASRRSTESRAYHFGPCGLPTPSHSDPFFTLFGKLLFPEGQFLPYPFYCIPKCLKPLLSMCSCNNNIDYVFCLLYTSDAADDLLCVDLGGRRIIKK